MTPASIILIILGCSIVVSQKVELPTWFNLTEISRSDLSPGGQEHGKGVFIARGYIDQSWIPGKMLGRDNNLAYIPYKGEKYITNIQVLYIPSGTAKWQDPFIYGDSGAIDGGSEPSFHLYICRAWFEGSLITGKYSKSSQKCYIPYYGEKHFTSDYEVLVEDNKI